MDHRIGRPRKPAADSGFVGGDFLGSFFDRSKTGTVHGHGKNI